MALHPDLLRAAPPVEAGRLNEALRNFGYTDDATSLWCQHVGHPELGGRTALQAWQNEQYADVISLVEQKASDPSTKRWVEWTRELIASGEIQDHITRQRTTREIVDDWRTTNRT